MADHQPGKLLVATDLSEEGDRSIAVARDFAARLQASLIVAHVMPPVTRPEMLFPQQHESNVTTAVLLRQKITEQVEARVGPNDAVAILDGTPGEQLVAAAEQFGADMIVLGGREPSGERVFGSAAEYVLTHSKVPVLIGRQHPRTGKVVAAVDLNDEPGVVVDTAARLTDKPLCAELVLVYVAPKEGPLDADTSLLIKQLRRRLPDETDMRIEHAEPGPAIVAVAERTDAELIVIGTHGRKGLARLVIGSVASIVARRASCSVLVVPLQRT